VIIGTLLLFLVIGINLIRSVKREVEQKEKIELLARDLEKANASQISLIHFITHQIKGFLTKSRNIFSALSEADGQIPTEFKTMVQEGFESDTKAVDTIQQILKASNIQKGLIEYKKETFDFREMVAGEVEKLKILADKKGIALTFNADATEYTFVGDKEQLSHAVRNLIDNSIKYTPNGSVNVKLETIYPKSASADRAQKIRFSVKDTGVGISSADAKRLFTEGGRGENSVKTNVESTGYGLYIVKGIIEAHGGTVRAESAGQGKGSEFIVEL
jgi:signal transduction histidine kinase